MIVKNKYYELKKKKDMQDGHFISAKQKLLYICTEENLMQFETIEDSDIKRIFWAENKEVKFLEEVEVEISEKEFKRKQREINGDWLNN